LELVVLKGDKMEAMIYHGTVSRLDRLLVEGKVYSFTNVQVKDAPEMFRSVNNKYVFVLTTQTEIEERHPDVNFPLYSFAFTPFDQMQHFIGYSKYFIDMSIFLQNKIP
jgi:Domain of unknown function DUF223